MVIAILKGRCVFLKVFVVKFRYIAAAAAALILIPAVYFWCTGSRETFSDNSRKIPIYSVERDDNKISLTFDCAWNDSDMDDILKTLDDYNIKASFFVTGTWVEKYPQSVKKICEKGHDLGNHSYNHADYTKMTPAAITADLDKCDAVVEGITGQKMKLMRAPSGGYNDTVVQTAEDSGRTYIQWSVDGLDYVRDATADSIKKRISKTEKGDIILMHNGTKLTAQVLPEIISSLSEKYEFVKVSELIYNDNYSIDNAGRQICESN